MSAHQIGRQQGERGADQQLEGRAKNPENEQKSPASGELPHCFTPISETVGKEEPNNGAGYKVTSPLSPPSPLKKQGAGLEVENKARAGACLQ
jgi:hypothetical protein